VIYQLGQQEHCQPLVYKNTALSYQSLLITNECTSDCLKNNNKIYMKYLRYVSMQSHHLQGAHYPCLLKLHFVKIVNYGSSVYD